MARKKHLQDVSESDMDFIDEKMRSGKLTITPSIIRYDYKVKIKFKNHKQEEFYDLLKDDSKKIVAGIGSAGSGKSLLSLAYALDTVKPGNSGKYKRIICMIPTCPAGNMNIGFLKGTLDEKIEPYLEADTNTMEKILDISGNYSCKTTIMGLISNDVVRYELVNFARGKTFDNSLILVNEAENYSKEEMLLILTRVGEGSKIILTGDLEQCDRPDIKKSKGKCGLEYAIEKLSSLDEFGSIEFFPEDVVRNPLITKILKIWK